MLTIQEYITTHIPRFWDVMLDPETECQELRQEADALAAMVGLGVNPEGRYTQGIWDLTMAGPLPLIRVQVEEMRASPSEAHSPL